MTENFPNGLLEGWPYPIGALVRDAGVNFAVFSRHARAIELCLFDADGCTEQQRLTLHGPRNGVFHGFLPGARAGLVYGYRAHGVYEPQHGHRFNPHKLLLDPCAREIIGQFDWVTEHYGYTAGHPDGPWSFDMRDNAARAYKARVAAPFAQDMPAFERSRTEDLVLYEVHVKGFSKNLAAVPAELRGTYAGLAHPASIAHFKRLGITTLNLLPVQFSVNEPALAARSTSNYWGYNTLGFFCPDPRLASCGDDPTAVNAEFRAMVMALHAAGLEVVLDVVYNHTPEGNEWGPTLSFRGLDNASWYHLAPNDKSRCENHTGCGNTVNVSHPRVTQFVLDSLRYWVTEMGVDGFRFDLATVLGRDGHGFNPYAAFFVALQQDPVLAGVHLIAEPWDSGPNGYQVGHFPGAFLDWNDRFRDAVRGYWLQRGVRRGEMALRLTASSDLFHHGQRRPTASVNFITAHDGFTLTDVVSYSHKHNLGNGENNADGRDNELCANHGFEGRSNDPAILQRRDRVRRAMLATLILAQGTPMLCAGDEIGKTQGGNNNAYCQDNAVSWLDWMRAEDDLVRFTAQAIALRQQQPLLRHGRWFVAPSAQATEPHITWHAPDGHELQAADWQDDSQHAFGCHLRAGTVLNTASASQLLLLFNPGHQALGFTLPAGTWQLLLDSSGSLPPGELGNTVQCPNSSLIVLQPLSI